MCWLVYLTIIIIIYLIWANYVVGKVMRNFIYINKYPSFPTLIYIVFFSSCPLLIWCFLFDIFFCNYYLKRIAIFILHITSRTMGVLKNVSMSIYVRVFTRCVTLKQEKDNNKHIKKQGYNYEIDFLNSFSEICAW